MAARKVKKIKTGSNSARIRVGMKLQLNLSMKLKVILGVLILIALLFLVQAPLVEGKGGNFQSGVLKTTLKNGLQVVIIRNSLAPVVTTVMNYLVGSNNAPSGFPGMAHAQEHMMFRGSPGLNADQLAAIMASMGGNFNAGTQQTITQYFLTIPSGDLDIALHLEAVRMKGILSTEQLWVKERGAIEQEVSQDFSSPDYIFYTKLLAAMFKGTPYEQTPLGSIESFEKTTGAMLRKFHNTWYAPNNAVLVIVGDIDPQKTLNSVKKYFDRIKSKKLPARPVIRFEPVKNERIYLTTDQPNGMAIVAFRLPGFNSPDYPACQVLADVLSSQRSTLFELVPQGKALFTEFSLDTMPQAGLGYAMAAFPKGADSEALVTEIQQIVKGDLDNGFSADLVEAVKRTRRTMAELEKNSVAGLAMAWSEAITLQGKASPDEVARAIEAVSVNDVDQVARKYLNLDQAIVAVLTPESSGKPQLLTSHINTAESLAPAHIKLTKLPEWAEKVLRRLEVPRSTINPVVNVLPNGLKLIVQPVKVGEAVSVLGSVRNNPDMEIKPDKEGVDQVLEELFSYGTNALDRVAFQKVLDEIGAHESAGVRFSLQLLADNFEKGVELLSLNLLSPGLPAEAFQVVKQQVAATVAGRRESPTYLADRALAAALFPQDDPALREATEASVSALSLADVRDYYDTVFRPDMTTIVVIGKVSPENVKRVIEKYFGSWKATGAIPETFLPPVPPNRPSRTDVPNKSRIQAEVALAHTLGLPRSHQDYYALELGNHILGGAFYATRLYRDLREESGLVYYVASALEMGVKRSVYSVRLGCDPTNVAKARDIVVRNLTKMQTIPVTAQELNQAKAILLREIPLSESATNQIAKKLIYLSNHQLPLDEPIIAARRYMALTAEEVKAAFARWMRPKDFVQVTEGALPRQ